MREQNNAAQQPCFYKIHLAIMRLLIFVAALLFAFDLVSAQTSWKPEEPSLSEILAASKADIIFIGSVAGYGRGYTKDGKGDSTEASYRITKVLKGSLRSNTIDLIFPGHIGFRGGEQIIFATSDRSHVDQRHDLQCPSSPCFYTEAGWSLPYSKAAELKVTRSIKSKPRSK